MSHRNQEVVCSSMHCSSVAVFAALLLGTMSSLGRSAERLGPFQPSAAKVWDEDANHRFVWRDQCGNNGADHQLGGGFEWTDDSRGFVASGKGWVGEKYRPGLMMLAFPDGNVLHAQWKATIPADKWLRIRYSLTNQSATASTNGLKFAVTVTDKQGKEPI